MALTAKLCIFLIHFVDFSYFIKQQKFYNEIVNQ